jgi:lipopolysaccharide export system protein LptA
MLVLSGNEKSKVLQTGDRNKKQVVGRVITYYVDSQRMVSEGEAEAVMEDARDAKEKKF